MKIKLKQRKILSMKYSFLVTLPQVWMRSRGIGRGDFLDFDINEEGNLVLIPLKENEIEE